MSGKGWQGNYFEDFALGTRLDCPPDRTLTAGDAAAYIALTGDRTAAYCGSSLQAHPLVVFHTVFGQTVRPISLNARANLGYAGIRWGAPVLFGDTLSTTLEVVGLKENSNRQTGVVYVRTVGLNQRGEEVLSYWRWVMVKKRGDAPTASLEAPVVPELPASVAPSQLRLDAKPLPVRATGARYFLEDYAAGERIDHYDGMTINPSDHMAFTRLFQNSAKVHFDARLMEGKPLVYGGVVISHAYAMALNGLEARLGIVGINAGAHTSPIFAGDTLYAFTEVKEVFAPEAGSVGALRLRLIGVKNLDPSSAGFELMVEDAKTPGKRVLNPAVVLDLDYWEAMPKRSGVPA
jgi:2-methylfumaryl-CoA hydratase